MKKSLIVGIGVILVVAAFVVVKHNAPPAHGTVIGVIAPLSGQYAFLGESERNAMLLSQAALAKQGVSVQLIFEDDKYDAQTGVSAYEKLKSIDHVDAVVAVSAPVLGALRPIVAKDGMLLIALGESVFHEDDTVFQLMPAIDALAPTLGTEAAKRFKRIAVVYSQGNALFEQWKNGFVLGAGASSTVETFALPAGSDLRTETAKILAFKPDATTVFLPLEDGITYLKDLELYDPKHAVSLICDGNIESSIDEYVSKVGSDIFNGCISTNLPDTKTQQFVSAYKAAYSIDPVLTADYAYDAVSILGKLSHEDKSQWVATLKDNFDLSGASGEIRFNAVGTRLPEAELNQYVGGKFVELR